MNNSSLLDDKVFQARALEAAIRIGLTVLLVVWCFNIVRPFILPFVWGVIIAVAIYPLYLRLVAMLGRREKLAATVLTLAALTLLIVPTFMLSESVFESSQALAGDLQDGALTIPPPPEKISSWPLVGERLYNSWSLASSNPEGALAKYSPQLKAISKWLLSVAAGAGAGILQFIISIIIAGVLLLNAQGCGRAVRIVACRLMGEAGGEEFASISGATIRSVAQGVLGVALIQATLAAIGLYAIGVPYAGLWTLLVLLLAVVQLPPLLVLGPIIAYVFSIADTVPAVVFMVWGLLVSISDTFLKPLFLGRGVDIPMLVILLGAIGGMILSGIIGLFVGAVILAVGYRLFMAWLDEGAPPAGAGETADS
jgi:predicted PurR-regulated permease PerM